MKWARRQYKTGHKQKLYITSVAVFVLVALISPLFAISSADAASLNPTVGVPTTFAATVAEDDPCDATGNPLSWVICPIVGILHEGTKVMDAAINHLMSVDATSIFDRTTDSGKAYYAAWNSFRIFGIALIVIAGLIMVISQAMGFDLFDAYTIKKVLPRLVLAVIGISLSWWLMWFLTNLTNDVGTGIRSVIYYPFRDLGDGAGIQSLGTQSLELLALGGGAIFLGIGGLLSLLATAALAALVAFLVLVIRQIVIVFLILLAPLAIACYVLPNTEKVYKLWWDSLSKALMMFPIITAFIATGHVFSAVASTNQAGSYGLTQIVALLAYFMPYFALPFTFRLAGGALATLGGLTNDRSRGAFDMLKNKRKAIAADRLSRAQNQSLWDNNSRIGRRANKLATWATDPVSNAAYYGRDLPGLRKRGYKIAGMIEHGQVEQSGKLFEELNKMGFNDKAYRLLSGTYDPESDMGKRLKAAGVTGPPTSIKQLQTAANILGGEGSGDTEKLAANAIHASMGRLATLYQDGEMTKASTQAAGILGLAAHGFASSGDLAVAANGLQETLGTGAATALVGQAQLMGARSRPETKNGYGVMYDSKQGVFVDGMAGNENIPSRAKAVLKTLNAHDLASAKGGAFDALEPTLREVLSEGGGEAQAVQDQLFSWAGPYSQASVDIKAKAIDFINSRSETDPSFATAWARYQRQEDPEVRRGGAPGSGEVGGPPPGGAPGGGR
jgi:hypothetical protein